jgi:hypothetical protein
VLDIDGVCSHYVTLALGLQRQAGDAHLLGELTRAFGVESAAQRRKSRTSACLAWNWSGRFLTL